MAFRVIVIDDAINRAMKGLMKDLEQWPESLIDVKVCVARDSEDDDTILIVYGPEGMTHIDILRKARTGAGGGGDSIRLYREEGTVIAQLANLDSTSLGPLRPEFRDAVVVEFKKLIA